MDFEFLCWLLLYWKRQRRHGSYGFTKGRFIDGLKVALVRDFAVEVCGSVRRSDLHVTVHILRNDRASLFSASQRCVIDCNSVGCRAQIYAANMLDGCQFMHA